MAKSRILLSSYRDSVFLIHLAQELRGLPGVREASLLKGR